MFSKYNIYFYKAFQCKMNTRTKYSKLRKFLLILLISLLIAACNKKEKHIVPDVPTDFVIDLNDPRFIDLNSIANSVIINSSYWGSLSAGYNNHGIIVYRAGQDEFYAFDRTCTFEEQLNEAVDLDIPTDLTAECPNCGSKYTLPSLAYPDKDGPATYPLKQYYDEYSSNTVWVHN